VCDTPKHPVLIFYAGRGSHKDHQLHTQLSATTVPPQGTVCTAHASL